MSNPRKFSEKIAIHQQKQAQQEREFNDVMRDLKSVVAHQVVNQTARPMATMPLSMGTIYNRVGIGGSLPNFPSPHKSPDLGGRQNIQPLQIHDHGNINDQLHSEGNYVDPMIRYNRLASNSINSKHNAHGGLVWHRGRSARADPSPYHHGISLQPEQNSSSWRRTVSDPSIQKSLNALSPRGGREETQSPPKSMISPTQRMTKSPDLISGMSGPCRERQGHMRKQANTSSLPDFTSLNLGSPIHNPIGDQEDRNTPPSPTNQGQFNVPLGPAPRRYPTQNTCGRQMFPRQISSPEQDNAEKQQQQQKLLMNQLYQQDNQGSANSGGSPGSPVMPPFSTWSPLAKEVLFSQQLAGLAAARAQEDYISLHQMQGQYTSNEGLPMGYQNEISLYPPPRYETGQIDSSNGISSSKTVGRQANGIPDILVTSNNASLGLARELGLGITAGSNPISKEDFSDDILTSVRAGLEPLNFEDYLMLAGANPDVAEQGVEDEFRQDRLSFQ